MKYAITKLFYAGNTDEVEADSVEEALDRANDRGTPILCFQCALEFELGEMAATVIHDENGDQVYNDLDVSMLSEENQRLKEMLRDLTFRSQEIRDDLLDRAIMLDGQKVVGASHGRWVNFKKAITAAENI